MWRGGDSGGGRGSGSWECLTLLLHQTSSAGLLGSKKEASRQELTWSPVPQAEGVICQGSCSNPTEG